MSKGTPVIQVTPCYSLSDIIVTPLHW